MTDKAISSLKVNWDIYYNAVWEYKLSKK